MIKIKLMFSVPEAIDFFRNAGLTVKLEDVPMWYENPHGDEGHVEMVRMYVVVNPHTSKNEDLEECLKKYLNYKKNELFLNPGKLEVYNLFSKTDTNDQTNLG